MMIQNKILSLVVVSISLFTMILNSSCQGQQKYDPEIATPDIDSAGMNHGYTFTSLGCLIHLPWNYSNYLNGYNEIIYLKEKKLEDSGFNYSPFQKKLVFELQRKGGVKFWFKSDYLKPLDDTVRDMGGNLGYSHKILLSEQLITEKYLNKDKIYESGSWVVNYKDSSIKIDFGKNEFNLIPITAKYVKLDASDMVLEQVSYFDSLYNGKVERLKKVITTSFVH